MTYVDAIYNRHKNVVQVAERVNGQRIFKQEKFEHVLYYEHPSGSHKSIFETPCKKFTTTDPRKFRKEQMRLQEKGVRIFESDIQEVFRHLAKHYMGAELPTLNLCFFDIEVDFDPDRGFAPTDNPFCAVTAITAHLSQLDRLITLALVPPTLTSEEAHAMCDPVYDENGTLIRGFEDTILFEDETHLLSAFLDLIDDSDVLSGWNSEGYDIPYLVNRIRRVLGEQQTKRFCLWGQLPREREYLKFGKRFKTYDLVGRVHLDYLLLYQKHNTQQQHSYRLDFIGEIEVKENKVPYEGTLDALYKNDFYRFVEYNRQDVMLLVKIDRKRKFIELANVTAHSNCVLLKTTVGSVALVEQAIINEMHAMGFVVPNRKPREEPELIHPDDKKPKVRFRRIRKLNVEAYEDDLLDYLGDLPDGERDAVLVALKDLNGGHDIGEEETVLWLVEQYLLEQRPQFHQSLIEKNTIEVEIEDVTPRGEDDEDEDGRSPVVGAYVAKPKVGIHYEVACVDINSLYPSALRALNMSPETIVGQVRSDATMAFVQKRIDDGTPRAEAWEGLFCTLEVSHMLAHEDTVTLNFDDGKQVIATGQAQLTVDFEDGRVVTCSASDLHRYIFEPANNVCISANGTIFRTDKDGIIPQLLAKWYAERKSMQGREKAFTKLVEEGIEIDGELAALLA